MHRQIVNAGPHLEGHHINHNTLDNRRSNLQLLTRRQHAFAQAESRLFASSPDAHAACTNFLARRGITALVPYPPLHE